MASVDTYVPYVWKDAPDYKTTPTSATNFNHIEDGIKKNNDAIKTLCTETASKADNTQTFSQAGTRENINSGETVPTLFGKIKKWFADLGNLAFKSSNGSTSNYLRGDGTWVTPPDTQYSAGTGLNLSGTSFSVKYGTASGTACQGNDTRLSNARPAIDVYSWAKQATKPSYSWNEITGKPTIPTVNNASLTIQKNGSTVSTFTANASSNVNCNISVPTKESDLTADRGYITGSGISAGYKSDVFQTDIGGRIKKVSGAAAATSAAFSNLIEEPMKSPRWKSVSASVT